MSAPSKFMHSFFFCHFHYFSPPFCKYKKTDKQMKYGRIVINANI
ncbi:unnamed protein product [Spirodela intermedia]|uniref:Uncharacterized protein n=1 Tax=Spirodela intermedia TaxID=51605 RepID=A0A7I8LEW1_SPIIN|nr:unnamed protein product [Spirodela intermedia]